MSVSSLGVLVTDTWKLKKKKSVDHSTSFFSITHTKLLCHTDTSSAVLQRAWAETKPQIFFTSIRKFSAGRKVSHSNIKSDSRQTQSVATQARWMHSERLLHIKCQNSSSYKLDWNRGCISLMTVQPLLEPTGGCIDQRCEQHASVQPFQTQILQSRQECVSCMCSNM